MAEADSEIKSSFRHDRPFAQYPLPLEGGGPLNQVVIPATAGIQDLNNIGR